RCAPTAVSVLLCWADCWRYYSAFGGLWTSRVSLSRSLSSRAQWGEVCMKLSGRHQLVERAQQGMCAAIAVSLAAQGADVALTCLDDQPAGAEVAARINRAGRRVH